MAWSFAIADPQRRLGFWTNVCLIIAVIIGLLVAYGHGGNFTCAFAWCGAAIGAGGLLGFLFGIPGRPGRQINIDQPGVVAFGPGNRGAGKGGVGSSQAGLAADPGQPQSKVDGSGAGKENLTADVLAGGEADTVKTDTGKDGQDQPVKASSEESNLVQVSDWVTKLLLGGGLTQLQVIPGKIWELAGWVAVGMRLGTAADANQASLAANQSFAAGFLIYFSILGFFGGYFITQLQFRKRIGF